MTVLILGSEGFIGSHCVRFFTKLGHTVIACDLLDASNFGYKYYKISRLTPDYAQIFQENIIDLCINASGNGNVQISIAHPLADFEANCRDVIDILENLRKYTPDCKYIHISSAAVYGNPVSLPIHEYSELLPISPYGWHKLISEKICAEYFTLYNLSIAIVRPFSVYGPGLRKQMFWDLFRKTQMNSECIEVYGSGMESRDFIFIDDLVSLFYLIYTKAEMKGEIYNAANGVECIIKDVIHAFINRLSPITKIKFSQEQLGGSPINWVADISRITELGYTPSFNLEEGIIKLTEWMKNLN